MLELPAHLEQKAAQLRCEGLGQIKMALAGTDTSSLLEILEVHFGHVTSTESNEKEDVLVEEEKTSETVEEVVVESKKWAIWPLLNWFSHLSSLLSLLLVS